MSSLWGDLKFEGITTPLNILDVQAKILKGETENLVYAEIERNVYEEGIQQKSGLVYDFFIKGKDMQNYSYKLLTLLMPVELYPLHLKVDNKTFGEINSSIHPNEISVEKNTFKISNEEDFIKVLRFILSSKRVKKLIIGIISLSNFEVKTKAESPF